MDDIEFLTYEQLLELHAEQLAMFGGREGVVDEGVVRSSLAQPSMKAFGEFLHVDVAHMAAAYLFHFAARAKDSLMGISGRRWSRPSRFSG